MLLPLDDFDAFVLASVGGVEVPGVLGDDEVIVLAVDEEGWDEGLLDVLSDRVQVLDIEVVLHQTSSTLSFIVDFKKLRAIPLKIDSPPPCFSASYFESFSRFEKGESKTTHPISWLASAYISAVTAPMLLPQIPMLLTVPSPRR